MVKSPLEAPVRAAVLEDLVDVGLLRPAAHRAALGRLRTAGEWNLWLSRSLLFLGATLILAGVAFFFAANWDALGKLLRLGLVELLLVSALLGAWARGLDDTAGKVLVTAAAVLVGIFLAVYGQTYQTGADAYELFLGWTLLIAGWVLAGRFGFLWLMALGLANLTLSLYMDQVRPFGWHMDYEVFWFLLGALNGVALLARDAAVRRGADWLRTSWIRWVVLVGALGGLAAPVLRVLFDWKFRSPSTYLCFPLLAWLILREHRREARELVSQTLASTCAAALLVAAFARPIFKSIGDRSALLVMCVVTVGVTSALAFWLRRLSRQREEVRHD